MQLSDEQLEWIVTEVVRRLAEQLRGATADVIVAAAPPRGAVLQLDERVVTAQALVRRLEGVARVETPARAIVTPAARDLLRERGVALWCGGVEQVRR
jgi:hypothetical protein